MASEQSFNSEVPTLCANGCGFFGRAETRNLCSKCYRDVCIQEAKQRESHASAAAPEQAIADPTTVSEKPLTAASSSAQDPKPGEAAENQEKPKDRCGCCNRKVGLAKGFKCRCGGVYCATHRYAEEHECTFDFKARGRDLLAKANPVVQADKLERI